MDECRTKDISCAILFIDGKSLRFMSYFERFVPFLE